MTHFSSELPDCLPLPELREAGGGAWCRFELSLNTGAEAV